MGDGYNAYQILWQRLAEVLPAAQLAALRDQHLQDLARDRQRSQYRRYLRYERQSQATIQMCDHDRRLGLENDPKIRRRAEERLARIRAWLAEHDEWRPKN
jgi:hypothetical protein